jgi:hypothetical protein
VQDARVERAVEAFEHAVRMTRVAATFAGCDRNGRSR